jgi:hypothetical protein
MARARAVNVWLPNDYSAYVDVIDRTAETKTPDDPQSTSG